MLKSWVLLIVSPWFAMALNDEHMPLIGKIACVIVLLTVPLWLVLIVRSLRYYRTRKTPVLGFAPGDRVLVVGRDVPWERATLKYRLLTTSLLSVDQPILGMGASILVWRARTDAGDDVDAHYGMMQLLPPLDRLAEL
ncbi:MAG: hypothetical protein AB7L09_00835 [Nitrospira sp.]